MIRAALAPMRRMNLLGSSKFNDREANNLRQLIAQTDSAGKHPDSVAARSVSARRRNYTTKEKL